MENSLPSGIKKNQLARKFEEFKQLSCPEPPEDDNLYDFYSELMEYDGHIAGLISSFLDGKQIKAKHVFRNEKLVQTANRLKDTDTDDIQSLRTYFHRLDELVQIIKVLV